MKITDALRIGGLESTVLYSEKKEFIFVQVRAPLVLLQTQADSNEYLMLLDEERCASKAAKGDASIGIKPFVIGDGMKEQLTNMRPFECLYAPYNTSK